MLILSGGRLAARGTTRVKRSVRTIERQVKVKRNGDPRSSARIRGENVFTRK
jgi:hypothetical protein